MIFAPRATYTPISRRHVQKHQDMELTPNQNKFVDSIRTKKAVFLEGPAGTGKTMLSCRHALEKLHACEVERILLTRPAVSILNEQHGFLPGDIDAKMSVWMEPLIDTLGMFENKSVVSRHIRNDKISLLPLGFVRGKTFNDAVILADEMQNSTTEQMLALLTRIGENSQLIVTGDTLQTDVQSDKMNGMSDFIGKLRASEKTFFDIDVVKFTKDDIKRSDFVRQIYDIYGL